MAVRNDDSRRLGFEPPTVRVLFNCDGPEPLRERFKDEPRVSIRTTGLGRVALRDTHFKIIDGGRMAYLTQHEFDSTVRLYELVDCLTVARWSVKWVARRELGDHMGQFETRFANASVPLIQRAFPSTSETSVTR